jgi:P4 family phage/plasmid primase-like protien
MMSANGMTLLPGQINLDWIPLDWPLTPLGDKKNPYLTGWQNKPQTITDIATELNDGTCHAVGLISGPCYNNPYGFVWVDVDGPSVYQLVEEVSGYAFEQALPATLTICSGKDGRERRLYKLLQKNWDHFIRNKYVWHAEGNGEKLEILWRRHQGVLMGSHPETEGYFTPQGLGFEWCQDIPEFPVWLLEGIKEKNKKQGQPAIEQGRVVGPGFAINTRISLERDIQVAIEATWAMPPEAADDYDIWITAGQALHSLDESLLDVWEEWSKQSDKYRPGECQRRWKSFSKGGGRGVGSLIHIAKENGWTPKENPSALPVSDEMLDHVSKVLEEVESDMPAEVLSNQMPQKSGGYTFSAPSKKQRKNTREEGKEEKGNKNISADEVTDILLAEYKGNLRYSIPHGQFFEYGREKQGLWSPVMKVEMLGDIRERLKEPGVRQLLPKGFGSNLISDVYDQLQATLCFKDWYEGCKYLLFTNGVLDVDTRELIPFKRELYLTQQIPYDYNPAATCEPIVKWLKHTQFDNWQRAQVLRAWLRATLLGTYEIQKFIEIVGPGKSGKSTYANLAVALVGKKNVYSTDFENLEKNRFEAASYMGKKLLLFQDADRWGGSVSRLKAITGNDWIRAERKYQNENYEPFQFKGLVIVTANEAIQSTDYTSGLARRRLTVPFDKPFTGSSREQRELIKFNTKGDPEGEFASLLPGLVNWLLDMTEDEMREYLMETNKKVEFFKKYSHTQNLRSNSILDWMEHRIVYEPGMSSAVGFVKPAPQGSSHLYTNQDKWLYASYAEFCKQCNVNVMSRNRFEPLFLDICRHQLNLNVYTKRNTAGMRVFNVVVRDSNPKYESYPSAVTVAADPEKYELDYGVCIRANPDARMEDSDETMADD